MDIEAVAERAHSSELNSHLDGVKWMTEDDFDRIDAIICENVASEMRDPGEDALDFIADCYSHEYGNLVKAVCGVLKAQSDGSRLMALQSVRALLEPQFRSYVEHGE